VESIAEDLLGLRIEQAKDLGDVSGMLLPAERLIVVKAAEAMSGETPTRRQGYTVVHELGHWSCYALEARFPAARYCRAADLIELAEREANVFAAELLMPEAALRTGWEELGSADALAARFDVSLSAMRWRLFRFGLVREPPR
jgi:Zn-dependent peptidase ImmA (M78 family)